MKITGPGKYRQINGGVSEVLHIERGIAFGVDGDGEPTWWQEESGFWQDDPDGFPEYTLVGPWEPEPVKWEPTGRRKYVRLADDVPAGCFWMSMEQGAGWRQLHIEQRSPSGETRWVPVEVEE